MPLANYYYSNLPQIDVKVMMLVIITKFTFIDVKFFNFLAIQVDLESIQNQTNLTCYSSRATCY